ncbi:MAG: nicotinate phosphoribosyltransferase [Rhizobiales bacterium]|nr:nicotinate phosphoribosyltransferase [Hyphomicrobiales bacterium]
MNWNNILLDTDSYKASHFLQYPPGATHVSSYVESRGGAYDRTLFFGLQAWIKDALLTPFSARDIDEAEDFWTAHGEPFNRAGWEHILKTHGGFLPLRIEALREGSVVRTHTALAQACNLDPAVPWLTSYIETALLRAIWYPTTVATRSKAIQGIIRAALDRTSEDAAGQLPFKLHDFGARGVSSRQSAGIGGAAHLVNFMGTDTASGALFARRFYGEAMAGFSIPAAEHSTITAWGHEGEERAYANMLAQFGGPGKLVAVVSDSWDVFHAVKEIWGKRLKAQVEASGGTLVVRPDSGDPETVPVEIVALLAEAFGASVNGKGFRVLNERVRVIQGDGINERSIAAILANLEARGFSADNIAFGMGGQMLQALDRDTLKFAMKASAIRIGGEGWRDVFKQPATDAGKSSKPGRLAVVEREGAAVTIRESALRAGERNLLEPVYETGKLLREQSFADIRARAAGGAVAATR